jgi:hypothetical protein
MQPQPQQTPQPLIKLRRCGYCNEIGHDQRKCFLKRTNIDEQNRVFKNKIIRLNNYIKRTCLNEYQIKNVLNNLQNEEKFALWEYMFENVHYTIDDLTDIIENLVKKYKEIIESHPQFTKRIQEFTKQQEILKQKRREYISQKNDLMLQLENLKRRITINGIEFDNNYYIPLNRVPKIMEFKITMEPLKKINPRIINLEEGEEKEEQDEEKNDEYFCGICLENISYDRVVLTKCSGKHHVCFTCIIQMSIKQSKPFCPLCREDIKHLSCFDRSLYCRLTNRFNV